MVKPTTASKLSPLPREWKQSPKTIYSGNPSKNISPPEQFAQRTEAELASISDLDFNPHLIESIATSRYFAKEFPPRRSSPLSPLSSIPCNYCWTNWPMAALFVMPAVSLVFFLRGQGCPSCKDEPERRRINETLMRSGPSIHWIRICQKWGMATNRFPYLDDKDLTVERFWSTGAANYASAEDLWEIFHPIASSFDPNKGEIFIDLDSLVKNGEVIPELNDIQSASGA